MDERDIDWEAVRQRMVDIVDALEAQQVPEDLLTAASLLNLACRLARDIVPEDAARVLFHGWGTIVSNFPALTEKERTH